MTTIEIDGERYVVVYAAGLEVFSLCEKYMIVTLVSTENPKISFDKKVKAKINNSDTDLYFYKFETEVSPDAKLNVLIAVSTFPVNLRKFLLFFSPLNKKTVYLIPLKICKWYIDSPIERLLEMHEYNISQTSFNYISI
ncbi:MAG: hypothetical protein QXL96_11475 [Ignisphaera sp.]